MRNKSHTSAHTHTDKQVCVWCDWGSESNTENVARALTATQNKMK